MKSSVLGFNQEQAVNSKLDLIDLEILNYIIYANGNPSMKHIIEDDISYVWLSHKKILEDLPILGIVEGTLRNRINALKTDGWITSINIGQGIGRGSRTYYSITNQCLSLIYDADNECNSKMTPRCNSKMTPNNKLIDNKLETNISKDILVDKSPKGISISSTTNDIVRKKSRWEQFIDAIDNFTDNNELRDVLVKYADLRLNVISKEDGDYKTFYVSRFVSILNDLPKLSTDVEMQCKIVQQSIDEKWRKFFSLKKNNNSRPNQGLQMTKSDAKSLGSKEEKEQYEENLKKEYEKSGRRAIF